MQIFEKYGELLRYYFGSFVNDTMTFKRKTQYGWNGSKEVLYIPYQFFRKLLTVHLPTTKESRTV